MKSNKFKGPKILVLDVETKPLHAWIWGLGEQYVTWDQIDEDDGDWRILSWSAKWYTQSASKTMYMDLSKKIDDASEKKILQKMWDLLDESDIIVTQNGKKFDIKKLNARFKYHKFKRYSPVKHIDTCQIAKNKFGFTSNSLAYLSEKINTKYKKLKHKSFPGIKLWTECIKGNQKAWQEMKRYNKHDVLALEELYQNVQDWDTSINFNVYHDDGKNHCSCGSTEFYSNGNSYESSGVYQRFKCKKCSKPYKMTKAVRRTNFSPIK